MASAIDIEKIGLDPSNANDVKAITVLLENNKGLEVRHFKFDGKASIEIFKRAKWATSIRGWMHVMPVVELMLDDVYYCVPAKVQDNGLYYFFIKDIY